MASDRDQDTEPDMLAGDVPRVLDAARGWSADVFGSNGGAVTGLAAIARRPGHIRTLVVHERDQGGSWKDRASERGGTESRPS
jgi:pimeloyl-ACP methyl ester carboxylesterase